MRTANPALSAKTFAPSATAGTGAMTIQGTVNKTGVLLILTFGAAAFTWSRPPEALGGFMILGGLGGLIAALVTIFRKTAAPVSAPVYAVLEGLFLGGISAVYERQFPGIVMNAVGLTFGTLLVLLLAYRSGVIKATENFKLGVVAATGAIGVVYFFSIILGFFGVSVPFIHSAGPIGIIVSLVIVVVAALNLVLDFDFIENGAQQGAPRFMEWYAAFGLMVTLVWLGRIPILWPLFVND